MTTERARELIAKLDEDVAALKTSDAWMEALRLASKLHGYSFGNVMLAHSQRPDVSALAGFQRWKQLGRSVRKGEKAVYILAPMTYKRKDEDGTETRGVAGFKAVAVFDVKQTDGPDIDTAPKLLDGSGDDEALARVVDVIKAQGYSFTRGDCNGANGTTDPFTKTVRVRDDVSGAQALKTTLHEAAHIFAGHVAEGYGYVQHRGEAETEAEGIAYVVSEALGLDSSAYSVGYLAHWTMDDASKLRKQTDRIVRFANQLVDAIG